MEIQKGSGGLGENLQSRPEQIKAARVRALVKQMPAGLFSALVAAILLAVMFWEQSNQLIVVLWLAALCLCLLQGVYVYIGYVWGAPFPHKESYYAKQVILGAGMAGIIWASSGLVFLDSASAQNQLFLSIILLCMTAGGAAQMTSYLPAFYVYTIPILLPLIFQFAMSGDTFLFATAFGMTMLLGVILLFGRNMNTVLTQSLELHFQNWDLAKEAESANMAKSRFLAAASHDLRQPMHALGLFIAALGEQIKYPACKKLVDSIKSSSEALEGLTNALLDISRLDAGALKPEIRDISIQSLLDQLRLEYELPANKKGISLTVLKCKATVKSDPALLKRILSNFMSNALRYTENGRIILGCRRKEGHLVVQIWDTGIGIPPDKTTLIFQEFYQVNNIERDRNKGLGLGLAIVYKLAQLLGHEISVKSILGRGSMFGITLPLSNAAASLSNVQVNSSLPVNWLDGKVVAVIDDDMKILDGMQILLENWGCKVITAESAIALLEKYKISKLNPNVFISDYRLRNGETGIYALRSLQAFFPNEIPGVLITGDTAPEIMSEAKNNGYHLLHKPVQPAKLRALLTHALQTDMSRTDAL